MMSPLPQINAFQVLLLRSLLSPHLALQDCTWRTMAVLKP